MLALIALNYAETIRDQPHTQVVGRGPRFWPIFRDLCRKTGALGQLVPDAYLAVAIVHGCEVITADEDSRCFPGLRCRHSLN